MQIERIVVGNLATNCYLVACAQTQQALVIDPGGDAELILAKLKERAWQVKLIVNTHGHSDHIGANRRLAEATQAPLAIHVADQGMLTNANLNLSYYLGEKITSPAATRGLQDGDLLTIGQLRFQVLHTPGHTPGSICLLKDDVLFAGDTLFADGVGRTDLPGGSQTDLIRSIKQKLFVLPATTKVYPGHGPATTIGQERRNFRL